MKMKFDVKPPENEDYKGKYRDMYKLMDTLGDNVTMSVQVSVVDLNNLRTSVYRHAYHKGYKVSTHSTKGVLFITRRSQS